jgi:hypothetical protein
MAPTNDGRPLAMVNVVWLHYRALAVTARRTKASQSQARKWTLVLAFGGALLSTLAGMTDVGMLGLAAAVLIAGAGYAGRELLSPSREDEWVRCRVLGEALKREVFKALVGVSPYDGPTAGDVLAQRTKTLLENSGLDLNKTVLESADGKTLPEVSTVGDYIAKRANEQKDGYYESNAKKHQKQLTRYKAATFVLGLAAALMSAVGAKFHMVALWVPVVTTAVAALTTFIQAERLQGLIPLFQQTAFQLGLAVASWEDQAAARAALPPNRVRELTAEFVNRCEEIMSQENEAWRAEWVSKEKKGSVEAFVKQLDDAKT